MTHTSGASNTQAEKPRKKIPVDTWDVIVIGGGPAGMMAAGHAAERGLKVLLLEKNPGLGKKLLITGGGRCNVTNSEFDTRILLAKYKDAGKFLFSPFSQYDVEATLNFFHSHNMPTKVENEKRTFPQSNAAASVLEVLEKYMKANKVTIQTNAEVKEFVTAEVSSNEAAVPDTNMIAGKNFIKHIVLKNGTTLSAKSYILATGGKSRPETGSTGDGFMWAKKLGHTVVEPSASLVPLASKDAWVSKLAGVSLAEAKITLLVDGEKQNKAVKGKVLFTHVGLSGPGILNLSKRIGELLECGDVDVSLDLVPTLDIGTLDKKLNELFRIESNINKKLKNCLGTIHEYVAVELPSALVKVIIELSGVNENTPAHSVTKENRKLLVQAMKDFRVRVKSLLGTDKAIVTSGGVVLTEIDPRTMRSNVCSNVYLVGDMLHVDRPSGGYSLQLCWTTGYVAGNNV